jgi:hypothetical protein
MIQFLKRNLRTLTWFAVGLLGVFLLALVWQFVIPSSVVSSTHRQGSLHAYTPTNHSENAYWSVGVTRDSNHLPNFNGSWFGQFQ